MRKESGLKNHKLPLDRCQQYQKGRKKVCKEPDLVRYRYILYSNLIVYSDGVIIICSDLPTVMWDFDNQMADQPVCEASV